MFLRTGSVRMGDILLIGPLAGREGSSPVKFWTPGGTGVVVRFSSLLVQSVVELHSFG